MRTHCSGPLPTRLDTCDTYGAVAKQEKKGIVGGKFEGRRGAGFSLFGGAGRLWCPALSKHFSM
jgi:hypothetical protein